MDQNDSALLEKASFAVLIFQHLGDCVHVLPEVRAMAHRHGTKALMLVKNDNIGAVYNGIEFIEQSLPLGRYAFRYRIVAPLSKTIPRLRGRGLDMTYVIDDNPYFRKKANYFLGLAGIPPERITACTAYEFRMDAIKDTAPKNEYGNNVSPILRVTEAEVEAMKRRLCREADWQGEPIVLLHVGSSAPYNWKVTPGRLARDIKWWGEENWRDAIKGVRERFPEAIVVFTGGIVETCLARKILKKADEKKGRRLVWTGRTPMRELLALQSLAHSGISTDTGSAHTAIGVGCPLTILYGHADPRKEFHCYPLGWGPVHTVIASEDFSGTRRDMHIRKICPQTVLRAWNELPPRPPAPPPICYVRHYVEGVRETTLYETRGGYGVPVEKG